MVAPARQTEPETMEALRARLVDVTLIIIAIFGLPALAASLMRSGDIGWIPVMGLHAGIYIVILLMTVGRRRLPVIIKSGTIILLLYIIGTSSFLTLLTAGSGTFFYLVAAVLAVLFFGFRAGLGTLLFGLLTLSVLFFAARSGILQPNIDFDKYAISPSSWITMIAVFTLLSSLTLGLIALMESWLKRSIGQMTNEIEDRKKIEHMLEDSIAEKDTLLKEVHHRVKSNLQVITSILDFQLARNGDTDSSRVLRDSRNRILIMSMIHDELYKSEDLSRISFDVILKRLVSNLHDLFSMNNGRININLELDPIHLGLDTAIPCGLIVNELVTNSLQHAFPGDRRGTIKVVFTYNEGEDYKLTISDDGVGFPGGLDIEKKETPGLQMVGAIAEQLGGRFEQDEGEGTSFTFRFREYFEVGAEMH